MPNLIVERHLNLTILHVSRDTSGEHASSLFARELDLVLTQTTNVDVIGILQNTDFLGSDVSQDTDSKTWTWERMACDKVLGHAQLTANATYLVLEKPLERLAERQMHLLGQSTHVVVRLDDLTRNIERFNTVWIDGTLCKPLGILNLLCLGIEYFDKVAANDFALLFRITYSCQISKELLRCIHTNHIETKTLIVVHHIVELVLAKHTMIDEDTCQILADSAIEEHSSNAGIHTS